MTNSALLLAPILLPIIFGTLLPFLKLKERPREIYTIFVASINACITGYLIFNPPQDVFTLVSISSVLSLAFRIDGLSAVFAGLVAGLWPLATLYAIPYMRNESNTLRFFSFYTIVFGITLGIAFSANFFTLYLFYEILSFGTLPLVAHKMDPKSVKAKIYYLFYSISGASLIFIGLAYTIYYAGGDTLFKYGGFISGAPLDENILLVVYFVTFLGFGVKSAVFPLHGWLPMAAVAPTPTTALLHAVAVVKAGVFGIARLTYYTFDYASLSSTWVQTATMGLAAFTIIYASTMMFREKYVKRALVYSTISNLSYIVLAMTMMIPAGLAAGLLHMVFHGLAKIVLFMCVGIMLVKCGLGYTDQIYGIGKRAPLTLAALIITSMSMIGIPLTPGFLGKWHIATAVVRLHSIVGFVGIGAIVYSTIMAALYLLPLIVRAFFVGLDSRNRHDEAEYFEHVEHATHDNLLKESFDMLFPVITITLVVIYFGLFSGPLFSILNRIANGGV